MRTRGSLGSRNSEHAFRAVRTSAIYCQESDQSYRKTEIKTETEEAGIISPPPHAFEKGLTRRVGTAWHGTLHLAQVSSLPFPLDVLHILSVSQGTTIKEAHILGFRTE